MRVMMNVAECREAVRRMKTEFGAVGFVPTMGALHRGHESLIEAAARGNCAVVVSIFVNPTQFAPHEDLAAYPRPVETDLDICRRHDVTGVFLPDAAMMYAPDAATVIRVNRLSEGLCGPHRPGHFEGVCTVVAKLFHIVPADRAYFGEKDYQQLAVIRQMVRDLDIPIEIVPCPTVREPDGLAMSSRNVFLSPEDRKRSLAISAALFEAQRAVASGEIRAERLLVAARARLEAAGIRDVDYVEIVDSITLEPVSTVRNNARMCIAARVGRTRLIDNVPLDASKTPR